MNIIFLDIDGVFNTSKCPNNCELDFKKNNCPCKLEYGIQYSLKNKFINLLKEFPDIKFVLISSWRNEKRLLNIFQDEFREVLSNYLGKLYFSWIDIDRSNDIHFWLSNNIEYVNIGDKDFQIFHSTNIVYKYIVLDDRKYKLNIDPENINGLKIDINPNIGLSDIDINLIKEFFYNIK